MPVLKYPNSYLVHMSAQSIPVGADGLWYVQKRSFNISVESYRFGRLVELPAGTYTFLYRLTDSTIHLSPPGTVVMEDTPFELRTHLGFVMRAYGKVLITGLGLGCVVRGLLQNPNVEKVVCIENSRSVLNLVEPHMPKTDRLEVIEADALKWANQTTDLFDCAWHDLWTDRDSGEPHLDIWHMQLFINLQRRVKHQGAWAFPRVGKRKLAEKGFKWMG